MNPLFLYVGSEILAIIISVLSCKPAIYAGFLTIFPDPYTASAAYAVSLMLLMGVIAYPLYTRRIYIKL